MEEIITCILEAEAKADKIVKSALEEAKAIILDAENESEKIKENAIEEFKANRKAEIKKAEEKAELLYNQKIEDGKKLADKLKEDSALKIKEAVEKTAKEIVG